MQRGPTGKYETTEIAGEKIRAFIPYSLPPQPPLELTAQRQLDPKGLQTFRSVELEAQFEESDKLSKSILEDVRKIFHG